MPRPRTLHSAHCSSHAPSVAQVLKAEGLEGPLLVEGTSYGAGLALAVAARFGERVSHLHLHVPYIPAELRVELGVEHSTSSLPPLPSPVPGVERCPHPPCALSHRLP